MPATPETPRGEAPGEHVAVVSLYERWRKIQSLWVSGPFQTARRVCLVLLLLVFYVGPWLTWNGGPAIWLDVPERKFIIFGATFWPQEFVLLSMLLLIAAFALFVFTVVAGRLWCGFACPQTVWTLCYVWLEKLIEGDRSQRIRLDRSRWSASKLQKKLLKYTLWALLALSISVTFVGYFTPIRELFPHIVALDIGGWEQFFILFIAGMSFLMNGVLREQVCLHMCPYARFQSVMFDHDTMIVSYDADRGDPRGSRPRGSDLGERGLGSCVDCKLCVHACPTGIYIRDVLQYECIGCAACGDACNVIMNKIGYEPNLIRFSSQHQDDRPPTNRATPTAAGGLRGRSDGDDRRVHVGDRNPRPARTRRDSRPQPALPRALGRHRRECLYPSDHEHGTTRPRLSRSLGRRYRDASLRQGADRSAGGATAFATVQPLRLRGRGRRRGQRRCPFHDRDGRRTQFLGDGGQPLPSSRTEWLTENEADVHETHPESGLPWYRFFWPWFIVILLTTSVVTAIVTVAIAFRNQDSLVDDRYYDTGNAINQRLAAEANAERLKIRATVAIDELTGEVRITLAGDIEALPERLSLKLSHATQASRDAAVTLSKIETDRFYGQLETQPSGRYYASLRPSNEPVEAPDGTIDGTVEAWRLQREIRLPSRVPLTLGFDP